LHPFPPYNSMGERSSLLQAVGIKSAAQMERAAYFSAWREKKLQGSFCITSVMGNAATRLSHTPSRTHLRVRSLPEMDDLFMRQARELDTRSARPWCTGCRRS